MDKPQAPEEPISLKFTLTESDFADFQVFTSTRSPFHRRRFLMARVAWFLLYVFIAWLAFHYFSKRGFSMLGFGVAFLCALPASAFEILTKPFFLRWRAKRLFRQDGFRSLRTPTELKFREAGFDCIAETGSGFFAWSAIVAVVLAKQVVYLFMTPLNALILPRRAFKSDAAMDAFARWATERQRTASVAA